MAEKVPIICPECAKQFNAPAEIVGRKIRCKNCGKAFVAKKAEDIGLGRAKAEEKQQLPEGIIPFKDDDDDEDGDGKPYEVTSLELAPRCPSCANELQSEEDIICLHCGFNLQTREGARTRKVKDVTGGDVFGWLLPGILSAVGFFVLLGIMLSMIIWRASAAVTTPEWATGDTGPFMLNCCSCCTIWTTIVYIWLMYKSGKFAITRLIYEPKPPEVEL